MHENKFQEYGCLPHLPRVVLLLQFLRVRQLMVMMSSRMAGMIDIDCDMSLALSPSLSNIIACEFPCIFIICSQSLPLSLVLSLQSLSSACVGALAFCFHLCHASCLSCLHMFFAFPHCMHPQEVNKSDEHIDWLREGGLVAKSCVELIDMLSDCGIHDVAELVI